MKRLLLTAFIISMIAGSTALAADLWGMVSYGDEGDVGPGKEVLIHFTSGPEEPPDTVYTDDYGQYHYDFTSPKYFYKVSCFIDPPGPGSWYGETIIGATLTGNYRADIRLDENK